MSLRAGVPGHVTNVAFKGMGEPLVNYGRVLEALRRIDEMANSPRSYLGFDGRHRPRHPTAGRRGLAGQPGHQPPRR